MVHLKSTRYEHSTGRTGRLVFTDIWPDNISSDCSSLMFYWSSSSPVMFPCSFDSRLALRWSWSASEKCPIWCARKDVLRLNKLNSLAVLSGVAKPIPAPALIALNIYNALNWKKLNACVNALILTPLIIRLQKLSSLLVIILNCILLGIRLVTFLLIKWLHIIHTVIHIIIQLFIIYWFSIILLFHLLNFPF